MEETLSQEEKIRYSRHFSLSDFTEQEQRLLKKAHILVIGAGGLASGMLPYLAAAGVGEITVVDADKVDITNLQRQVIYTTEDVGKYKAEVSARKLMALNPFCKVNVVLDWFTSKNALELAKGVEVIVDATDNFPTRYLVNDTAVISRKPYVFASILEHKGTLCVFNHPQHPVNYRDLFPVPPRPNSVPNCAQAGVIGVLPGIMGGMQANEVIKIIVGSTGIMAGKFLTFDAKSMEQFILEIPDTGAREHINELIDYEDFCGLKEDKMKSITVQELKEWKDGGEDFHVIDVREEYEFDEVNMGAELIPLGTVMENVSKFPKDKKVVVHCRSGKRSATAISALEDEFGYDNLYNLEGGILAWIDAQQ